MTLPAITTGCTLTPGTAPIASLPLHRTVWATRHLLSRPALARLPASLRAAGPSAAGLALIPLAVPHIDAAVERALDRHLRPHLPKVGVSEWVVGWVSVCGLVLLFGDSVQRGIEQAAGAAGQHSALRCSCAGLCHTSPWPAQPQLLTD